MVRPSPIVAIAVALAVAALPAQGVVNPTLLQAPDEAGSPLHRAGVAGVFATVRDAVVFVAVEVDGPRGKFVIERASSGVVVDRSGLVLTWAHLVRESVGASDKRLLVMLNDADNTQLPASLVRVDDASGLALLRVAPPPAGLAAAELGPDRPASGEPVLVAARPAGKEMLAFGGVASPALAEVTLAGQRRTIAEVFLTDSRNDERCDGAPVFDHRGRVLGLYASEHVQRDKSEPTLDELKRPSFGVVLTAAKIRHAFRAEFAGGHASLHTTPALAPHRQASAVARIAPAVVSVWAGDGEWPQLGSSDPGGVIRRAGLGSGVVLSKTGLVVTNVHVIEAGEPRVRLADGRSFPATVVKRNAGSNLALLQLTLPAGQSVPAAPCAPDDDVVLGEVVLAVGNPLGIQPVVTGGVVSARRDREGGRIQADANLGNQNGGGAVVDVHGRLLGIGDAGAVDPIEQAFMMRGDRATTETNLSTFVGIRRVRQLFAAAIEDAAPDESIRAPVAATAAEQSARQTALTSMVEQTAGALLNIYVAENVAKVDEDDPFASMKKPELMTKSLGSGVIVDRSGLAISNWHVVDDAVFPDGSPRADHAVTASVFGGKTYQVTVLAISREDDLSLLQLQLEPGEEVKAVELGNSDQLAIGEEVAAIGNPHGRANTVTFGVVTAKEQGINVRGRHRKLEHLIETDAAINGGNSGGALLDMGGRLVGINSAGGGTFNNKGYAIAVDHVRNQVLGLLLQAYKLRSPDLGLRVMDDAGKVVVMDVDPRGPAARAGVQSGDHIVTLAGTPITWSPGYALTLLRQPAGSELALEIERKGQKQTVQVTPLPAPVWSVVRQSGLQLRDVPFAEDAERVRGAAIALHRAITGDATGEPQVIPQQVVAIERIFAGEQPPDSELAVGDFLLAAELRNESGSPVLVSFGDVSAVRDLWNERELGSYDGQIWRVWRARGTEVKAVEVRAKRLFW